MAGVHEAVPLLLLRAEGSPEIKIILRHLQREAARAALSADRDEREAREDHQPFLASRHAHVHTPGAHRSSSAPTERDAVDADERVRVLPDDAGRFPSRSSAVPVDVSQWVTYTPARVRVRPEGVGTAPGSVPPPTGSASRRPQGRPRGPSPPTGRRTSRRSGDDRFSRRVQAHKRRLHPPGAGAGERQDRIPGLEQVLQVCRDALEERTEFGAPVMDEGLRHPRA